MNTPTTEISTHLIAFALGFGAVWVIGIITVLAFFASADTVGKTSNMAGKADVDGEPR